MGPACGVPRIADDGDAAISDASSAAPCRGFAIHRDHFTPRWLQRNLPAVTGTGAVSGSDRPQAALVALASKRSFKSGGVALDSSRDQTPALTTKRGGMKRLLRWISIALGTLVGLGIVAYTVVYVLSERILRRTYAVPTVALSIPTDPASIIEGQRLATVRGCFSGCHGKGAEGHVLFDEPMIARIVAPNLTAAVRQYSDERFADRSPKGCAAGRPQPDRHAGRGIRWDDGRGPWPHHRVSEEFAARIRARSGCLDWPRRAAWSRYREIQDGGAAHHRCRAAARGHGRGGGVWTVPCTYHLRGVPRDKPARCVQSRFQQSGSADRRCLFPRSVRRTHANGCGTRGTKTWRDRCQGTEHLSHLTEAEIAALYSYLHAQVA